MANDIELGSIADHTPIVLEDDCGTKINVEALGKTMTEKLRRDSPLSAECCIFRVPKVLRRHNPKAYAPGVVSIGPFHRRGKQFQLMENVKQWYLHNFISDLGIDMKTLIDKIDNISEFEKRAREFYAEPLDHLSENKLIEMMILDGCFLLELFRRFFSEGPKKEELSNDPILNMACMGLYLFHDILLLENQLPWFVLKLLYSLAVAGGKYPGVSLSVLVLTFLLKISVSHHYESYIEHLRNNPETPDKILHILDLARNALVLLVGNLDQDEPQPHSEELPATGLSKAWVQFTNAIVSQFRKPENETNSTWLTKLPPATSLSEAGVKFKKSSVEGLFKFDNGVFEMPELDIGELTESLLRNLVAFEQCYHGRPHQITSHVILMDNLIDSSKDIDLLCEAKIISNWFSSEKASQLFNNLHDDTVLKQSLHFPLCIKVNKYYNTRWHRWVEKLRRDYFGNPWTIISLVAAIILLILTILQTAFTVQQYYHPRR